MAHVSDLTRRDGADLAEAFGRINAEARRVAGGPGDMPQRVALLHAIFRDSGANHCFPEVALHGALWAYGFYERRGSVNRMINYRYFYDRNERARRSYMLFEFAQGFKQANRSVFIDTYTNYYFTKLHGEHDGADTILPAELLEALNRVHHAARADRLLPTSQRREIFETALMFEQENTVGPKVREEVGKFDCPVLTRIVLKPIVHFNFFPRLTYLLFSDFGNTDERVEKALRSYDLAEQAGWDTVGEAIRYHGVLPQRCLSDPVGYADSIRATA